jgi:hypothetical protein
MAKLFELASKWETIADGERTLLRELVRDLVGYPCKLSCQPNNGSIDIYVLSDKKKKVTDWLELQPSGAIGIIYDHYPNPDADPVVRIDDACEDYNDALGLVFEEDSDSESDSDVESAKEGDAEKKTEEDSVNGEEKGESTTKLQ